MKTFMPSAPPSRRPNAGKTEPGLLQRTLGRPPEGGGSRMRLLQSSNRSVSALSLFGAQPPWEVWLALPEGATVDQATVALLSITNLPEGSYWWEVIAAYYASATTATYAMVAALSSAVAQCSMMRHPSTTLGSTVHTVSNAARFSVAYSSATAGTLGPTGGVSAASGVEPYETGMVLAAGMGIANAGASLDVTVTETGTGSLTVWPSSHVRLRRVQ